MMTETPPPPTNLPKTMRAVQGKDYGDIDEMLSVQDGIAVPQLSDLPPKKRKTAMLIKTLAVSLAPGDVRVLSGLTRELQGPPSFPYIPGGDCAGIVVQLPEESDGLPFQVGDRVACRFTEAPRGALGEYAIVSTKIADKIPLGISADAAAALVSASPATVLVERIRKGERVLVMGARGGVGAHFCQLLRHQGASVVVGVSSQPNNVTSTPISADECIDYTKDDVFSMERFQEQKFDVLVDLAGHGFAQLEKQASKGVPLIVKSASQGGRFLTVVPPIGPTYEIHGIWALLKAFVFPLLWKAFVSRTIRRRTLPKYTFAFALPDSRDCVTQTLALASNGKLTAVLDPKGPYPFTTEGVRAAFRNQASYHSLGKTVIRVAAEEK